MQSTVRSKVVGNYKLEMGCSTGTIAIQGKFDDDQSTERRRSSLRLQSLVMTHDQGSLSGSGRKNRLSFLTPPPNMYDQWKRSLKKTRNSQLIILIREGESDSNDR